MGPARDLPHFPSYNNPNKFKKGEMVMKKFTKLLAVLCAVSLILGTVTIPAFAADEPDPNLIFGEEFEGSTVEAVTQFEGWFAPQNEVKTDASGNKYVEINATHTDGSSWLNGGYTLNSALGAETYKVTFDFNFMGTGVGCESYAGVSLAVKSLAASDPYSNNFRLLGCDASGNILVNKTALSGDLSCTIGNWYHYEMKLNKVAGTYSVEITQAGTSAKATQTGTISPNLAFDGLMFGATAKVAMDNINVSLVPGPPQVKEVTYFDEDGDPKEGFDSLVRIIKVTFTDTMKENAADYSIGDYVEVTGGSGALGANVALSSDKKTFVITLAQALAIGDTVTLKVKAGTKSTSDVGTEADYISTKKVGNPNLLLNKDFEDGDATLERWDGTATSSIETEANGNKYIKVTPNWANNGFSFSESIPTDGGDYNVTFDFMIPTNKSAQYVCLNEKLPTGNDSADAAYNQFGLIKTTYDAGTDIANFVFNDENVADITCEAGKWYSYSLSFTRASGKYKLTISERDNSEVKGEAEGTLKDQGYCAGMMYNKVYNSFKFYYDGTICVDDIMVEKVSTNPVMTTDRVSFIKTNDVAEKDVNKVSLITNRIALNFGTLMKRSSIEANVELYEKASGTPVSFTVTASGSTATLEIPALKANTEYTLKILSGAKSATGLTLGSDFVCNFKTKDKELITVLKEVQQEGVKKESLNALKDGAASAIVEAVNTTDMDEDAAVVVAYYDENNKLLSVTSTSSPLLKGTEEQREVAITISKPAGTAKVKVMLWKSIESGAPMSLMVAF